MLIQLDHDQLEIRTQAHIYSELGDDKWREIFLFQEEWRKKHPKYPEGKDWNPRCDVYAVTGSDVFGVRLQEITSKEHPVRDKSKPVTLGMSYGLTEYGLSWRINSTVEEAKEIISKTFIAVPGMKKYYALTREDLICDEEIVTMFGAVRHLPFKHQTGKARKWAFKRALRQAVNVKIQGPSSDITVSGITDFEEKYFGLDILRRKGFNFILNAEVHDSGGYDATRVARDQFLPRLKYHMEHPGILKDYGIIFQVPLFVDIKEGANWSFK